MVDCDIKYTLLNHKNYIECVYEFCKDNRFSMILKGSLAKGTATKYSDIDLIILGEINDTKINEIITLYGNPVMTNFTEKPKGILILVYQDGISIDLDIRDTITQEDLVNSKVLLKYNTNFIITNNIIRKQIISNYIPNRPIWYKTLRLLHKGIIKYLSNKTDSAYDFLSEIKENLKVLKIYNLNFDNNFETDIQCIFEELCKKFNLNTQIKILFNNLFKEF
ncbi:nucleotidyltransferase domain-containing protein [Clostridium estertheticum]|uniref:nucleotidyltransferase domain-containing protein n=1 Tax=Clostridium estertheticum TaxID=238834 RepID=UPI0013E97715|nr:nucleotidyltransferase domain-containing protein [Clostridium estertheticum]MBZ9689356.1 nucleotidyltransferase domain-containing protein [Clostridium estertheticum]